MADPPKPEDVRKQRELLKKKREEKLKKITETPTPASLRSSHVKDQSSSNSTVSSGNSEERRSSGFSGEASRSPGHSSNSGSHLSNGDDKNTGHGVDRKRKRALSDSGDFRGKDLRTHYNQNPGSSRDIGWDTRDSNNGRDIGRDSYNNSGRDSRDTGRDYNGRDNGRDNFRDTERDGYRDSVHGLGRDSYRDNGRDVGRDNNTGRDSGRDSGRDNFRDVSGSGRNMVRDSGRDSGRESTRDSDRYFNDLRYDSHLLPAQEDRRQDLRSHSSQPVPKYSNDLRSEDLRKLGRTEDKTRREVEQTRERERERERDNFYGKAVDREPGKRDLDLREKGPKKFDRETETSRDERQKDPYQQQRTERGGKGIDKNREKSGEPQHGTGTTNTTNITTSSNSNSSTNNTTSLNAKDVIKNDYSQHFVDSGERPQNFIRDSKQDRYEDHPNLKTLFEKKNDLIAARATPPFYKNVDLRTFDLTSLGTLFDVVLIDPPWEEYYHRTVHVTQEQLQQQSQQQQQQKIPFWNFEELEALPINAITASPSFVFLWVGSGGDTLDLGRHLLAKWGFRRSEDIVWAKTNIANRRANIDAAREKTSTFLRTKEHCLMGIKGSVRRKTDGHIIHPNVYTDVIVSEEPELGSLQKPEELYHVIEHFCLGRRRLELFGEDHNIRAGWVTLGDKISVSNIDMQSYMSHFQGPNGWLLGSTPEIEACRPKSPERDDSKVIYFNHTKKAVTNKGPPDDDNY